MTNLLLAMEHCPHARGGEPRASGRAERTIKNCPHARGGEPHRLNKFAKTWELSPRPWG